MELAVVDLPGRYVLRSIGTEVGEVELQEDMVLTPKLAQADRPAHRAGQREIGCAVSHFQPWGTLNHNDHKGRQHAQY